MLLHGTKIAAAADALVSHEARKSLVLAAW
jgi:hypothetical protein